MTTYQFANTQHSLVLRDNQLIPWHPHANMPSLYVNAQKWLEDGSPKPKEFADIQPIKDALARSGVRME